MLASLFAGAGTAVAVLVPWLPPSAARQADEIDPVFWVVIGVAIVIFAVVASVLVYSIVAFRVRADDDEDGPPVHGNTALELAWTAIPTAIVTAIAIYSAVVLGQLSHLPRHHLTVDVTARQYTWLFTYPGAGSASSADLRLPVGESTLLRMTSLDVIHAFFVPEFRQNEDVVPGMTTTLVVTPTRLGTYPVICNELCGLGHALMRADAIVMPDAAFAHWEAAQRHTAAGPPSAQGKAAFLANGCNACHTLRAAGATGTVGPDLDRLGAEAQRAHRPLLAFIRQSIVDPNAYVEPGYPRNVMPQTFSQLPKPQLDALVAFLAGR